MANRKPHKVPKIQQVSVRIPGPVWQRLAVLADVLGKSQAWIIATALQDYFAALPPATRHAMDQILAVRDKV